MLEGSNQAEGNRFLRAIKVRSRPSFGEVKLETPCKLLWYAKTTSKDEQRFFEG
jgi:hypothetical protein